MSYEPVHFYLVAGSDLKGDLIKYLLRHRPRGSGLEGGHDHGGASHLPEDRDPLTLPFPRHSLGRVKHKLP